MQHAGAEPSELATGSFELLERAGTGVVGEVWRARDARGGTVALKLARGGEGAALLAREAQHAALAVSPRLPELLDVGWLRVEGRRAELCPSAAGARAFLALRWIDGKSVRAAVRDAGPTERLRALALARDVGDALSDLHAAGIAHGDVKPDNIVVDEAGRAYLVDLGLACPAYERDVRGATPRYLARGDAELGDARARDLAAFGVVLAETISQAVARADAPFAVARAISLPPPFDAICAALLAPSPASRPSPAWVADAARTALRAGGERASADAARALERERGDRDARLVRAAYLRLRRVDIERARTVDDGIAPWAADALRWTARIRSLMGGSDGGTSAEAASDGVLRRLRQADVARWLTAIVGPAATAWPIAALAGVEEAELAQALTELARELAPRGWTLADVERAVRGSPAVAPSRSTPGSSGASLDVARTAELALALARVPPEAAAIDEVEHRRDAPRSLVLTAADALRRQGDVGRARALVLRTEGAADALDGLAAEILRRAGDTERACETAGRVLRFGIADEGRARAVIARVALDAGKLDEAEQLIRQGAEASAASYEIAALVASARGETETALEAVREGEALSTGLEQRARFAGFRGYALHGSNPEGSLDAFAAAADFAARAGAVVEEATYLTGVAAAAVDAGQIGRAVPAARRAALLWEHLARPAMAARALLALAAAHATVGAARDAEAWAADALQRAREAGDVRAEAYAHWVVCDVSPNESHARAGAERAAELLAKLPAQRDDELRASARLLRSAPERFAAERIAALDRLAADPAVAADARLTWWGVRGARAVRAIDASPGAPKTDAADAPHAIVMALARLADVRAPIGTRGPALGAGSELAARLGRADVATVLLATVADLARDLERSCPPELQAAARAVAWAQHPAAAPPSGIRPEQSLELERLVQSFQERERLAPLLNRVVDALVLWTGAERGLLLLRAPDGRLVARAGRNLARSDLRGEQLALSTSLARQALEAREPVVAVDAAGEYGSLHQSIHALKLRSVLAVPLLVRGEPLGVVYLDDRARRGTFGERELAWTRTVASLAALAIADARDQLLLRRAARRERRASEKLAILLAEREAKLDAVERELAKAKGERGTRFRYDAIVGESEPMREMLRLVDRVTTSHVPVLICGESGSGKELVARAIHNNGPRAAHPFVTENCGAIPEGLLESALFGHVRGAFTGADRPHAGLFEVANGGTLFLDEIGEMSLGMQAKLLRVLEDGLVRPLGSERTRNVDVRIIAATHRDLEAMVRAKTFREDLFYRMSIIQIRIPPLRERPSDIPLIVQHLIRKHAGERSVRVTAAAMDRLVTYPWPGNVRRLENEIRRALVLCDGLVDKAHLSTEVATGCVEPAGDLALNVRRRVDALERELVREALDRTDGNQTQAAKLLGLSRFGLQKMMKRLAIA